MAKKRNQKWFKPVRGSYLPSSWQGWLCYLPYSAYLIFALVVGLQGTNTAAKAVLFILPNWVAAAAVMTWIAKHTS